MARGKPTSRSAARNHAKQTKPRSSGSPTYPRLNDDDREAVDRAVRQLTESEPFRLIGQATAIAPTKRDEDDPLLTRNRRINSENWRADVEVRFILRQRRRRTWISVREIAEWYAERSGRYDGAELDRAYGILQHDLFVGDFEEGGRTQVRYIHPSVPKAWMTRDMLQRAIAIHILRKPSGCTICHGAGYRVVCSTGGLRSMDCRRRRPGSNRRNNSKPHRQEPKRRK